MTTDTPVGPVESMVRNPKLGFEHKPCGASCKSIESAREIDAAFAEAEGRAGEGERAAGMYESQWIAEQRRANDAEARLREVEAERDSYVVSVLASIPCEFGCKPDEEAGDWEAYCPTHERMNEIAAQHQIL